MIHKYKKNKLKIKIRKLKEISIKSTNLSYTNSINNYKDNTRSTLIPKFKNSI